jgi:hypothetical protein
MEPWNILCFKMPYYENLFIIAKTIYIGLVTGQHSTIEIQTTGPISMKFIIEILLNEGKVCSRDSTPYPPPHVRGPQTGRASTALTV